jgi:hypothetical protein
MDYSGCSTTEMITFRAEMSDINDDNYYFLQFFLCVFYCFAALCVCVLQNILCQPTLPICGKVVVGWLCNAEYFVISVQRLFAMAESEHHWLNNQCRIFMSRRYISVHTNRAKISLETDISIFLRGIRTN